MPMPDAAPVEPDARRAVAAIIHDIQFTRLDDNLRTRIQVNAKGASRRTVDAPRIIYARPPSETDRSQHYYRPNLAAGASHLFRRSSYSVNRHAVCRSTRPQGLHDPIRNPRARAQMARSGHAAVSARPSKRIDTAPTGAFPGSNAIAVRPFLYVRPQNFQ